MFYDVHDGCASQGYIAWLVTSGMHEVHYPEDTASNLKCDHCAKKRLKKKGPIFGAGVLYSGAVELIVTVIAVSSMVSNKAFLPSFTSQLATRTDEQ